jgi:hypothetical protein
VIVPDRLEVIQGQTARFYSSYDPDTSLVHKWSGPGEQTSGTAQFIVNTTNLDPSSYTITLNFYNNRGVRGSTTAILVVNARPRPVALISPDRGQVRQGQRVRFVSKSYHPDRRRRIKQSAWQTSWGQTAAGDYIEIDTERLDAGMHKLTLEVMDDGGARDSAQATLTVLPRPQASLPPVARISPDSSRVNRGSPVRFFNRSYHRDGKRKIISADWQTSWGQTATGDYIEIDTRKLLPGEHIVVLKVADDNRASDSAKAILIIEEAKALLPPVAIISPGQRRVHRGERADFVDASYHPVRETRIVSRRWNTQWGQTHLGNSLSVDTAPLSPGTYWITLQVADQHKKTDSARAILEILPSPPQRPPIARIMPAIREVQQGEWAEFDGSGSTDPDGKIATWIWSLEGRPVQKGSFARLNTRNLNPGNYNIRLEVTDNTNARDAASATLIVRGRAQNPVARITPRRLEVQKGEPARFDGSGSSDPDGKIRAWTWSLNDQPIDGRPAAQVDTSRLNRGEHRVRLEVTDNQGLTARDEALLVVIEAPGNFDAAIIELDALSAPVTPKQEVWIRALVANQGKVALRNVPLRFDVGGVRIAQEMVASLAPGETREIKVSWIPKTTGRQIVIATINPENQPQETDRSNNLRRHAVPVVARPRVRIEPNLLEVSQGDAARFTAQLTAPGSIAGSDVKYSWRGPGNRTGGGRQFQLDTSELRQGDYNIALEISDDSGIKANANATLTVRGTKPKLRLTADNQSLEIGRDIRFSAAIEPQLNQVEYQFVFGDREQTEWSGRAEAVHRYGKPGDYTVRLLARRTGVDIGEASIGISIKGIAYAISLKTAASSIRAGHSLSFLAHVEPPADGIDYRFIFGDGQESGWTRDSRAVHAYARDGGFEAAVEAQIGGAVIRSPLIRVNVSGSTGIPWLWLGAGLAALAATAAVYGQKTRRLARVSSGITVVPQLNLEDLRVETQGRIDCGCEISLRSVPGHSQLDIEASAPIVDRPNG